jgi:hypothetical protein
MWQVTLDGTEVLAFAGARAQEHASECQRELVSFLEQHKSRPGRKLPESDEP